jgi:hypothetical protein
MSIWKVEFLPLIDRLNLNPKPSKKHCNPRPPFSYTKELKREWDGDLRLSHPYNPLNAENVQYISLRVQ